MAFVDRDDDGAQWVRESQRVKLMGQLATAACLSSGFPRIGFHDNAHGCNVLSPLFNSTNAGRSWLRRTLPATPHQPEIHRYTSGFVFPAITIKGNRKTAQLWFAPKFNFNFNKQTIEGGNLKPGMLCNLVIEVTVSKEPHPTPYVGLPAIGPYENYGEASAVAIFIESYDQVKDAWFRTQFFHQRPLNKYVKGIYVPEAYLQVKRILQLLEGTVWASTNEHFKDRALTVRSMEHIVINHLKQTVQFIDVPSPRPDTTPLPREMSIEENAALMAAKHPTVPMGPSEAPSFAERNVNNPDHPIPAKRTIPEGFCDLCWILDQFSRKPDRCQGGPRACTNCKEILHRPCTWSPRPTLVNMWNTGDSSQLIFTKAQRPFIHQPLVEPFGGRLMIEEHAAEAEADEEDDE